MEGIQARGVQRSPDCGSRPFPVLGLQGDRLRVGGIVELTEMTARALLDSVMASITRQVKVVDLDLSKAAYVDSGGLGVLISLRNTMERRGGSVCLHNPTPFVRRVLELTHLHRVLEIMEDSDGEIAPLVSKAGGRAGVLASPDASPGGVTIVQRSCRGEGSGAPCPVADGPRLAHSPGCEFG